MGREYAAEIAQLGSTIQAAAAKPLAKEDVDAFRAALAHPIAAVGVGGSTVGAAYASRLHRHLVGAPARVATTLEFTTEGPAHGEAALLVSAGGRNKDVLAACEVAIELARELSVWTANVEAPLAIRAREAGFPSVIDTSAGVTKDGYLATNTLLSTLVTGLRLYRQAIGSPMDANAFAGLPQGIEAERSRLAEETRSWDVDSILVLHAGWGQVAAVDLETRLHEAGLLPVQTADLRSFAHGRHLWMARRPRTGVVALGDTSGEPLLKRTLKLLPAGTPVIQCASEDASPLAAIELTLSTLLLTDALSRRIGVDPGRPSVPDWGRKIYGLGPSRTRKARAPKQPVAHEVADDDLTALTWFRNAIDAFQDAVIRGLVLDLDGTLLERRDRERPPEAAFFVELNRLAREGLVLGFASGRGRSLYDCIHAHMDKGHAEKVVLGFYNGGVVRTLAEGDLVGVRNQADGDLATFRTLLEAHQGPHKWFNAEVKEHQINVGALNPGDARRVTELSLAIIDSHAFDLRGASSSLGLDVFPSGSSKMRVVEAVARIAGAQSDDILRIGDRGDHGGNDYLMLNHALGLSVDRTNPRRDACWALIPAGVRGTRAALHYLRALQPRKEGGHALILGRGT